MRRRTGRLESGNLLCWDAVTPAFEPDRVRAFVAWINEGLLNE